LAWLAARGTFRGRAAYRVAGRSSDTAPSRGPSDDARSRWRSSLAPRKHDALAASGSSNPRYSARTPSFLCGPKCAVGPSSAHFVCPEAVDARAESTGCPACVWRATGVAASFTVCAWRDRLPGSVDEGEPAIDCWTRQHGLGHGCIGLDHAGMTWNCFIGEDALDQGIISKEFLGQPAPVPGRG